jgi:hypothetical protein
MMRDPHRVGKDWNCLPYGIAASTLSQPQPITRG